VSVVKRQVNNCSAIS